MKALLIALLVAALLSACGGGEPTQHDKSIEPVNCTAPNICTAVAHRCVVAGVAGECSQ